MLRYTMFLILFISFLSSVYGQKKIKGFTLISESDSDYIYIKNTEVTIGEYMEFINSVMDSIARRYLAMNEFEEEFLIEDFESYGVCESIEDPENQRLNYDAKLDWEAEIYYPFLVELFAEVDNPRYYRPYYVDQRKVVYSYSGQEVEILPENYQLKIFDRKTINYVLKEELPMKKRLKKGVNNSILATQDKFYKNRDVIYVNKLDFKLPVTNISFEQAKAYCYWKTRQSKKGYRYELPTITDYEFHIDDNLEINPLDRIKRKEAINQFWIDSLTLLVESNRDSARFYKKKYKKLQSESKKKKTNVYSTSGTSCCGPSGVLDGVYIIPTIPTNIDLIEMEREEYLNKFYSTNDYYPYDPKEKNLKGLFNNVSEWTLDDTSSFILNNQELFYRDYQLNKDINAGNYVYGGNWWYGLSFGVKLVDKKSQLETIGFRCLLIVEKK